MDDSQLMAEARLITAMHAREVADFARGIVGSVATGTAAEHIRAARRLRLLSLQVLQWTVRSEVLRGEPWSELAAALGRDEEAVRAEYEAGTAQWTVRLAEHPDSEESVETARALDEWYRAHADDLLDPAEVSPVSALFTAPPE
ncbi:hypothetical protein ABZ352_18600 [Streptomyces griseofuscus]|uniref:hypothetical protein n=1 Tax=Streptomyces griseofuscus TaxID=146922 RepID=UPI0033DD9BBD